MTKQEGGEEKGKSPSQQVYTFEFNNDNMVNVCECYWPPFLSVVKITEQLDKLYNTELLFGVT